MSALLKVIFFDQRGDAPLREGAVVDRSAGGFRILTSHPHKAGTKLDLEVHPKPGSGDELRLLEGKVTHAAPLADGRSAMGIRLQIKLKDPSRHTFSRHGWRGRLSRPAIHTPPSLMPRAEEKIPRIASSAKSSRNAKVTRTRDVRKGLAAGALLILLLLVGGVGRLKSVRAGLAQARAGSTAHPVWDRKTAPAVMAVPPNGESDTEGAETESLFGGLGGIHSPQALLALGQGALNAGRMEEAIEYFVELRDTPGADGVQRYLSLLGHAGAALGRGERGLALERVREALDMNGAVPAVWHQAGQDLLLRWSQPGAYGGLRLDEVVNFDRMTLDPRFSSYLDTSGQDVPGNGDFAATSAPDDAALPLVLEVDTTHYMLTVLRDGQPIRQFPVGLGLNGSTPFGEFQIANKIADPDWYNRGNVVPAGSPENPLGKSWMGLGQDGIATTYGIHPTNQPESIGHNLSQGCVRMRPEDAEVLYGLCAIGTPVRIHS